VLLLFNHSAVAKYFNVNIGNGGVLWQQSWQLAPMESRAISVRDLIASQAKDRNGMVLPASLEQGEISWFTPNPSEGKGRLLQIDSSSQLAAGNRRVARNFSCGYNLVLCGAYLQTSSISFADGTASSPLSLGPVVPMICTAFSPTACTGQSYSQGGSGYTYNWQSNNTSIATVYGSTTSSSPQLRRSGVLARAREALPASRYLSIATWAEADRQSSRVHIPRATSRPSLAGTTPAGRVRLVNGYKR